MAKPLSKPKSLKAQITRTSLVLAAAALLRERGPEAVTYRKVAEWPVRPRPRWATISTPSPSFSTKRAATTLNCGSPVPRRWLRPPMPSAPRNVASAWSTFCWRRAFQTTRYPCPPIMLSSSPQPKRRWLPRPTARDARLSMRVNRILVRAGVNLTPSVVVALVDGGAVKAISEGYDVREIARMLLETALDR